MVFCIFSVFFLLNSQHYASLPDIYFVYIIFLIMFVISSADFTTLCEFCPPQLFYSSLLFSTLLLQFITPIVFRSIAIYVINVFSGFPPGCGSILRCALVFIFSSIQNMCSVLLILCSLIYLPRSAFWIRILNSKFMHFLHVLELDQISLLMASARSIIGFLHFSYAESMSHSSRFQHILLGFCKFMALTYDRILKHKSFVCNITISFS